MKHGAIARIEAALALRQHKVDVRLLDAMPGDIDIDRRDVAVQPACRKADERAVGIDLGVALRRSEEHTSELQSIMRIQYAAFCLNKKNTYSRSNNSTRTTHDK